MPCKENKKDFQLSLTWTGTHSCSWTLYHSYISDIANWSGAAFCVCWAAEFVTVGEWTESEMTNHLFCGILLNIYVIIIYVMSYLVVLSVGH